MKHLISAIVLLATVSPSIAADKLDVTVPECTVSSGSTCPTNLNADVDAGSGIVGTYVKQDGGTASMISCIVRDLYAVKHTSVLLNWIWRQHRHEFFTAIQNDCNPVSAPPTKQTTAAAVDNSLGALDAASDNSVDFGYVYRQAAAGGYEGLSFPLVYDASFGWYHKPTWGSTWQAFPRRAAHTLASMAFGANGIGAVDGTSAAVTWALAPQTNGTCTLSSKYWYSSTTGQHSYVPGSGLPGPFYIYWKTNYNRMDPSNPDNWAGDSWMWSSSFGVANDPIFPVTYYPCGSNENNNHPDWMLRLLRAETQAPVAHRLYGVYEQIPAGGTWTLRPICGSGTPYASC